MITRNAVKIIIICVQKKKNPIDFSFGGRHQQGCFNVITRQVYECLYKNSNRKTAFF